MDLPQKVCDSKARESHLSDKRLENIVQLSFLNLLPRGHLIKSQLLLRRERVDSNYALNGRFGKTCLTTPYSRNVSCGSAVRTHLDEKLPLVTVCS